MRIIQPRPGSGSCVEFHELPKGNGMLKKIIESVLWDIVTGPCGANTRALRPLRQGVAFYDFSEFQRMFTLCISGAHFEYERELTMNARVVSANCCVLTNA